ncbi:MAG: RNA-guided pseudouridylation complex pseudouridine synthase subunit Cbf5 [archaeon]
MKLPFEKIERKIAIKREAETDSRYGCRPEKRSVEKILEYGIVNLNKPSGPTSHQVSDYVKKILKVQKAGHSGTLDPNVSGVLPIAIGRATKIVQVLLTAGKEYVSIIHLHSEIKEDKIREVLNEFIGKIMQLPPIKSSVKRQLREREIYYIEILEISGRDILLKIGCQAGTYIRKYAHDLGEKLGTGAHMAELVRTKAGPFNYENWVTLQELKDAFEMKDEKAIRRAIQPVENGVGHLPKLWIIDTAVDTISHGAALSVPGVVKLHDNINQGDIVAIMTLKDELVAIGEAQMNSQNILAQSRGIVATKLRVFMQAGIYPKFVRK